MRKHQQPRFNLTAAVIIWVVLFVVNRDVANGLLPLLVVLMFVNVDSKIGEIIRQLKEMK
jgi:uncharacterized membrane protein YdfJ with MMPL/SSD domain